MRKSEDEPAFEWDPQQAEIAELIEEMQRAFPFPDPLEASAEGVVAAGGRPNPGRLLSAYSSGIFPWPHSDFPLLWFSPEPRFYLPLGELHVPRSLKKVQRSGRYRVTFDTDFANVIRGCALTPRPGQNGTWITPSLISGYESLHRLGFAHSVEAWEGERLVGGLYGVSLGTLFFGESMFARRPDASKVAFVTLCQTLADWGFIGVDCQVHTDHLQRFGAKEIPRAEFCGLLQDALERPTRRGKWLAPGQSS